MELNLAANSTRVLDMQQAICHAHLLLERDVCLCHFKDTYTQNYCRVQFQWKLQQLTIKLNELYEGLFIYWSKIQHFIAFRRAQISFRMAPLYSNAAQGTLIGYITHFDMIYYNPITFIIWEPI